MPFRVKQKQRLGHHQTQHGITQKLQPLVVASSRSFRLDARQNLLADCLLVGRPLVRKGPMRQSAHQKLWACKSMPQRNFQFTKKGFHRRLNPMPSSVVFKPALAV
jgi:hypothetical protein